MGRVEHVERDAAERPPHLGGERRAAHAEQDDVVELLGRGAREGVQLVDVEPHAGDDVEPAEPAVLAGVGPERRVVGPDPLDETATSRRRELGSLGADPVEQLLEGVGELLHALGLERRDDVVVVDTDLGEPLEQLPRLGDALGDRLRDPAVVLEGATVSAASCSRSSARSAPRRTSRPGTRGSSSTSRPRGSAASPPLAARNSQRGPATPPASAGRRASRSRSRASPSASSPGRRSPSRRRSASVSTRETKKPSTDATCVGSPPPATRRSSPRMPPTAA